MAATNASVWNAMMRTISDVGTVALAVTDGMLHFELAVAYEVFGADVSGVGRPLV